MQGYEPPPPVTPCAKGACRQPSLRAIWLPDWLGCFSTQNNYAGLLLQLGVGFGEEAHVFVSAVLVSLLPLTAPARSGQACRVINGDSLAWGSERIRIVGLNTAEVR